MVWFVLLQLAAQGAADVDRAVAEGIRAGAYPGAVVVVGTGRRVLHAAGIGSVSWAVQRRPDPDSTLYDLASLTKVVAIVPAFMMLVESGMIDLDDRVQEHLPGFRGDGKNQVTVRHLLEHRSGLRAFLPLDDMTETAEEARERVLREPLRWPPGGRVVYGDLNAMLLGWIAEARTGMPLDRWLAERLYRRVGMDQTAFGVAKEARSRAAPVGLWRGHDIAGEVHDQNAARLGGVSGHAGLYSTGRDLARYAQLLLAGGRSGDTTVFRPETVERFTRRGAENRALGWQVRDTTSADDTGTLLSPAAFGHTGFTGTSIWIDPVEDLFVVILTNRVYAPRSPRSFATLKAVRGAAADAAVMLRRERCGERRPVDAGAPAC